VGLITPLRVLLPEPLGPANIRMRGIEFISVRAMGCVGIDLGWLGYLFDDFTTAIRKYFDNLPLFRYQYTATSGQRLPIGLF
jgi:hypothetical protein